MEAEAIFLSPVHNCEAGRAAQDAVGLRRKCPSVQKECLLQARYASAKHTHTKNK